MVNDRDEKFESHEEGEGEYHFSDDQSTYELEPEAESIEAPKLTPPPGIKEKFIALMNQHRRIIIGVVVFVVLMLVVYFMVMPASTPPTTEFAANQAGAKKPATQMQPPQAPAPQAPTQQTLAQQTPPPPASTALPVQQPNPVSMPEPQPAQPEQQSPAAAFPMAPGPVMMPPQPSAPATGSVMDRLTSLEQQNAKLVSMQADYTQRITNYEQQNKELQAKVAQMSTQLGNVETSLNQITQVMLNKSPGQMPPQIMTQMPSQSPTQSMRLPPSKPREPKMAYTVQAIIPGRAWLKSDSGDTVTVAEGDILRDYGRITKIDPYDGLVTIDNGSKIITLSYGSGSEE